MRPSIDAGSVGWSFRRLDGEAMREAAAHLIGEHDFSSFRAAECQAKSPVKTLRAIAIISENSRKRTKMVPSTASFSAGMYAGMPVEVAVGGATIFVMDVERFEKV